MKKLLLILLLTILPIQYSWSMAAVYCQHESSKVTHFGHHGHHHQAQAGEHDGDDGDDGGNSKPGKLHGDCEVCHHAVQLSLPGSDAVLTAAPVAAYAPPGALHYHSYIADGPPRPNWSLVA